MSYSHYEMVKNGDSFTRITKFNCDNCSLEICESDRYYQVDDKDYCVDCFYVMGKITDDEYLSNCGFPPGIARVELIDGKAVIHW